MSELATTVAKVSVVTPETTIEQIGELVYTLEGMAKIIKEARAVLEQRILEKLRETGEFRIGDMLYTLAKPKKVKARSSEAIAEKVLEITGGDFKRFCECLSANAWKYGTVKRLLDEMGAPETFDLLFSTEYEDKLEVTKVNLAFAGK